MASTPTSTALLRQIDATLQLIMTLSMSLTTNEIAEVRQGLARAYDSMGAVLGDRILSTGLSYAREFIVIFIDSLFTSLNKTTPTTRGPLRMT